LEFLFWAFLYKYESFVYKEDKSKFHSRSKVFLTVVHLTVPE
jgi:hypothetical protein